MRLLLILFTLPILSHGQIITTVAGSGVAGYAGDGGPATLAELNNPGDLHVDNNGNIYIADLSNHVIRRIDYITGVISTIAGTGIAGFSGDGGLGISAELYLPSAVHVDGVGNIYISDFGNQRIRVIDGVTGVINTIAGTGFPGYSGDGGPATSADLNNPFDIEVDTAGHVYVSDNSNNVIRRIDNTTGIISTFAGTGVVGYAGDGGPATLAEFNYPTGLFIDVSNDLYLCDEANNVIRKIDASTGDISTVAGVGTLGYSGDGGSAMLAEFGNPSGVYVDTLANIYISDEWNDCIRKVEATSGIVNTIAGTGMGGFSGDGGLATLAQMDNPTSVFIDSFGKLFLVDAINQRVRVIQGTVGINIIDVRSRITAYPNPTNGRISFQNPEPKLEGSITVYDMMGKQVFKSTNSPGHELIVLDISGLANGIYVVELTNELSLYQTIVSKD